ncbi:ABC transporter permease [Devosia epidermidihirudinis]|uniref:ABC transporter permease n=1 Tax=Devosia epidermidihirudinis TaxID=1293439 RepID=A0A0F5QCR4_9HYPH|nr:ABC transporter permease [Devosia epidermidihirudinis]KKC38782.1 ABC transporter permease [Devosia epidermidihirudinis]
MTDIDAPNAATRFFASDVLHSFKRSPAAIIGATVALILVLAALLAPWIAPYDPFDPGSLDLMDGFTPPWSTSQFTPHWFALGSDNQGRDMLSAILYGSRVSLFVAFAATGFSLLLGVGSGLIAGYVGGIVDAAIMRVTDVQLTFPAILIALLIFGIARGIVPPSQQEGSAVWVLIFALGLSNWPSFARTVRGAVLVEKSKDYVAAAQLIGVHPLLILLRHILPNVLGPVLVIATIGLALTIIEEATLSYLGVGVPPTQPSLGTLIRIGQQYLFSGEWWILAFPAIALVALALSVNLLGDWLRDALNPRLR